MKSSGLLINLLEAEKTFFFGDGRRTLQDIVLSGFYDDMLSEIIPSCLSIYTQLLQEVTKHSPVLTEKIKARINFLKIAKELKLSFNSEIRQKKMPRLLTWYSVYFMILATQYRMIEKYTISAALALRSLEVYRQGILIHEQLGTFNIDRRNPKHSAGAYLLNNDSINGIGTLWTAIINIYKNDFDPEMITGIWNAIKLRNTSIIGHGICHANNEQSILIGKLISSFIMEYDCKFAPAPQNGNHCLLRQGKRHWQMLTAC